MSAALQLFTDFFDETTGPAYLTGPTEVVNDAMLRNYEAFDAVSRSKRSIQGGNKIQDMILLDDPLTAATYKPGEAATIQNVQGGNTHSVNWRFVRVYVTWNEKELLLNEGGGGDAGRFHQYKKLRDFKYQQAFTSLMNKIERLCFASASNAQMEADAGQEPYSIQATITSDGLAPSGFTTVQGLNPTNEANWRNQTGSYTAATPFDTDNGIVAGFDQICQLVKFKAPSYSPDGSKFTESELKNCVILTNKEGRRDYMKALRANNDITRAGPQDPSYSNPVFEGVQVVYAEVLDDLSVHTAGSPDYWFVNMNLYKTVFHSEKWMDRGEPMRFPDKPDTFVVWFDTYYNLMNCSRRRHGYLQAS